MKLKKIGGVAATVLLTTATIVFAQTREQIRIVGSSTVFPYTQAVAEEFTNITGRPAPVVESTGTGGGFQAFCAGVGVGQPDITGASRPMTASEYQLCQTNGVTSITEVLIGYDGLSIAHAVDAPAMPLTKAQIYLALASEVPVNGQIVANPYTRWNQIDPALPDMAITVFGPPPTSGTRDAFVELVMRVGCAGFAEVTAITDATRRTEVCSRMRQDGPFIEAGENDNLIVQRIGTNHEALGIFGYSFLYENLDTLKAIAIDGVEPNETTIADGTYPVSRPLFFYVKNQHRGVIPGLDEFIAEYVSEAAFGPGGYLTTRGLIPLGDAERAATADAALNAVQMTRY